MKKYTESDVEKRIKKGMQEYDCMLFKSNNGGGYIGKKVIMNGKVYLKEPRFVNFNVDGIKGFHDLFGVQEITITPEMVGKKVGVLITVEVKKDFKKYSETSEQIFWKKMLTSKHAISIAANSLESVKKQVRKYIENLKK